MSDEIPRRPLKKRSSLKQQTPIVEDKRKEIEETSKELAKQLSAPKEYAFPSVQRKESPLRGDLERIVEEVWVNDMHEVWTRIRKSLSIGEKRSEHAYIHKALDDARKLSFDAYRLYVTSKKEYERWEKENEVIYGAMWINATRALQQEKDQGQRSKQITDSDIKAMCAVMFPDEWTAQEKRKLSYKLTVDSVSQLSKEANEHCEDLRVMLRKLGG